MGITGGGGYVVGDGEKKLAEGARVEVSVWESSSAAIWCEAESFGDGNGEEKKKGFVSFCKNGFREQARKKERVGSDVLLLLLLWVDGRGAG